MSKELPNYGGQAVIEGVMMRGARVCSIAVRAPDQSIVVETKPLKGLYLSRIGKLPFLRGLLLLGDALILGMQALTFSAKVQAAEEAEKIEGVPLTVTMLGSMTIGVAVFFLFPAGVAHAFERWASLNSWSTNLLEGLIRLSLLIAYIWAIGWMPDVRRVYGYHGAEHMTINAFEAGAPLQVDVVAQFPREHPRCGTAFLLTIVVLSALIFTAIGPLPLIPRLASRILLVPVLAALAYEYIRMTSKFIDHPLARLLAAPNLALQSLTTRKPDGGMIEVAIASFKAMRESELVQGEELTGVR